MNSSFLDYYLCPEEFARFGVANELGQTQGFFRFGKKITCFGRSASPMEQMPNGDLPDVLPLLQFRDGEILLPFDTNEILENLRKERYVGNEDASSLAQEADQKSLLRLAPFPFPCKFASMFQRFHLRERKYMPEFPSWPIDKTVDNLCAELMSLSVKARTTTSQIPLSGSGRMSTRVAS